MKCSETTEIFHYLVHDTTRISENHELICVVSWTNSWSISISPLHLFFSNREEGQYYPLNGLSEQCKFHGFLDPAACFYNTPWSGLESEFLAPVLSADHLSDDMVPAWPQIEQLSNWTEMTWVHGYSPVHVSLCLHSPVPLFPEMVENSWQICCEETGEN